MDFLYKYLILVIINIYLPKVHFKNYVQITLLKYDGSDRAIREIKAVWINQTKLSVENSLASLQNSIHLHKYWDVEERIDEIKMEW